MVLHEEMGHIFGNPVGDRWMKKEKIHDNLHPVAFESAGRDKVLPLSRLHGEPDGDMSLLYATAFVQTGKTVIG